MNPMSDMKFFSSFSSMTASIFDEISEHLKRKSYWMPPCSATRAVKSVQKRMIDKFLRFTVDLKLNRLL
jgi:hypothetical protein